ncbi:hypothetical protein [Halosolutus gelatinilyticus]|uniref:hypothetical protein n=1 Tax=Halosolutus gelatinilyticus TaxID=2931975 RepID=UPI001FF25523|nr:hypothetical protein [Halosolutus gelatinilyticus]
MPDRPPSPLAPPSPTALPAAAETDTAADAEPTTDFDRRVVATTSQLAAAIERSLGVSLDDGVFEALLVELDRNGYVEWVAVTRTGEYVWDLSGSPSRIAAAVAEVAAERFRAWIAAET